MDYKRELEEMRDQIELCIDEVKAQAREMGCTPYQLKNTTGELLLGPLITTKANICIALIEWERAHSSAPPVHQKGTW